MIRSIGALSLLLLAQAVCAEDPIETDGDKYKLLFENERVRVLEYRDLPGEKTQQHHHPEFVLFAVTPFQRKIHLPDGNVLVREFQAGDVLYSEEQTHIGENTGTTPSYAILVEMKAPAASK